LPNQKKNSCPIIYSKTGESADKLTATRQNPTPLTQRRTQVKENQVLMICHLEIEGVERFFYRINN
jgi:hypothetical protein